MQLLHYIQKKKTRKNSAEHESWILILFNFLRNKLFIFNRIYSIKEYIIGVSFCFTPAVAVSTHCLWFWISASTKTSAS